MATSPPPHQHKCRAEIIDSHISALQNKQIEEDRTQKQHLELHESLEKEIFFHGRLEQVLSLSDRQQASDYLPDERIEYAKNDREDCNKPQHHHEYDVVYMSAIIEPDPDISLKKLVLHLFSPLSSCFCADKGNHSVLNYARLLFRQIHITMFFNNMKHKRPCQDPSPEMRKKQPVKNRNSFLPLPVENRI